MTDATTRQGFGQKSYDDTFDIASALQYGDVAYDPLEYIDGEDDEDWMDDDGLLLPEQQPPEHEAPKKVAAVYCPETAGSAEAATRELITVNNGRRPILMAIINWTRDGMSASELFEKIEELEVDNKSVYDPVSYCRMLERAGALTLDMVKEGEDGPVSINDEEPMSEFDELGEVPGDGTETGGIGYLTIQDSYEPIWRATEDGIAVYEELAQGNDARQKMFEEDAKYSEIYLTLMNMLTEGGKQRTELGDVAETFPQTKKPLKLGNYFVDVLESTQTIAWKGGAWQLTDLGKTILPELNDLCESRKQANVA